MKRVLKLIQGLISDEPVLCDGDSGRKIELRKWTRKNKKEPWYPKRAKSYGINSKNQLEMTIKALQNLLLDM